MATKQKTGNLIDRLKWILSLSVFTLAIVGNSYYSATPFLYRVLGVVGLFILGLVILALTDFGSNAIKLMRESRTELRRVVWPTLDAKVVRSTAVNLVLDLDIHVAASNVGKWSPILTILRPLTICASTISDELRENKRV